MSEQELAKLREMLSEYGRATSDKSETPAGIPARLFVADDIVSQAVPALLAEVERLRAENGQAQADELDYAREIETLRGKIVNQGKTLHEKAQTIAALREMADFAREVARELASPRRRIAGTEVVHLPDELMAKARALLEKETQP